ncbi:MAG: Stk1 family PASTA domain-containing Ser/Thr kinase [Clostridia bacterium]|nr:Stk1 family PASTA domain-containing Ser/Thr kinase [Clostridia bacterium]
MNVIGKIIGNRYEILKEVGNGGMATVYKAKDHVLNRNVAVKVLKDEFTTDSEFIKRFNSEAQAAANLQHPNIVSIYDVGYEEETNIHYIVMELIKGKTLKQIINKDGVLSWKWAVNIAIQIASALEMAHKNDIIHRDIKPHNIIINEDGTAKVTDFGIAKAVSNSTITAFGTTIGSVHYFSPEQAKGSVTDAKSDIYSLGVVMYEMLTGKVPFDADTPVSVALKHMQEEVIEPIEINDEIPSAVNDIVMKAMQKDPINRYQSATEMLADLSEALKDPDGDFVIIENKDGGYTRIMQAVSDDDIRSSREARTRTKTGFWRNHPKTKIAVIGLSLVLLFFVVFLTTKIILDGGVTKKVNIPNLVGKTQAEAQQIADDLKITLELGDPQASSTVEEGKVISQDPQYKDGEKIKEGSVIKIILSKGPETNELPDFKGEKIEDIREIAKELGITLEEVEENSDSVDEGVVIKQETKAGTLVRSGDTVKIIVSKGAKKTTVPTVIDMDEGTAKATLSNAKLKVNVTYKSDESKDDGKVISQSIDQGKEVTEGTTVDIVVNKIEKAKPKTKKINLEITAPGSSSDNEIKESKDVKVMVLIDNTRVKEETIKAGGEKTIKIEGNVGQKVEVTFNGTPAKTFTIEEDFADPKTVYVE